MLIEAQFAEGGGGAARLRGRNVIAAGHIGDQKRDIRRSSSHIHVIVGDFHHDGVAAGDTPAAG